MDAFDLFVQMGLMGQPLSLVHSQKIPNGGGGSRTHVQTYRHPKIYAHSQFYLKFI